MRWFEILDIRDDPPTYVGRVFLDDDGGYVLLAEHPGRVFHAREKRDQEWTHGALKPKGGE